MKLVFFGRVSINKKFNRNKNMKYYFNKFLEIRVYTQQLSSIS